MQDECHEIARENFLRFATRLEPVLRLLVTSGEHLGLEEKISNLSKINIVPSENDIHTYLESTFDTNHRMRLFVRKDPALKTDVIERVKGKAAGV